ncbi:MAG: biotin/lipoyl-binding protein [Akkermansiaceae bacterium]|nr:biotin/lipoyl-binding protein [Akkermansiaceae bacterium]
MSLAQLTNSNNNKHTSPGQSAGRSGQSRRSYAWLLPVALVLGFIIVIASLFGKRLLPAVVVETAPVITLRLSEKQLQENAANTTTPSEPTTTTGDNGDKGNMIFQASGWVEPDPYITYVPTLINGVVDEVKVLEGQAVKKGDLLATLIDEDAKLDLREAEQKIVRMKAQIQAHCAGSDIAGAELTAAMKKVDSLKAQLAEAEDNLRRLESIPAGAVPVQQVVQARLEKSRQVALVAEAESEIPRIRARLAQIQLERLAMTASVSELETARDRAKLAKERTRITAPMNGIVLRLHAAPGKKRMLGMDDPKSAVIVELYDPEHLQARIDGPSPRRPDSDSTKRSNSSRTCSPT